MINSIKNFYHNKLINLLEKHINIFGLIVVCLVIISYNILFVFSFLPITEGWFSTTGNLINQGNFPYRDFYLYLTPLYPKFLSLLINMLGDSIYVLRGFGILVILGVFSSLYFILIKFFKPHAAAIATIVACIYYQSGVAHITYDFTQFLTLFTIISILMLINIDTSFSRGTSHNKVRTGLIYCFFAGFFSSLAFFTKQSNGAFIVLFTALCFFYLIIPSGRNFFKPTAIFLSGLLLPTLTIFLWLLFNDALSPFFTQIFTDALAVKGSPEKIFFAWFFNLFSSIFFKQTLYIAYLIFIVFITTLFFKFLFFVFNINLEKKVDIKNYFILILIFLFYTSLISYLFINDLGKLNVFSFFALQVNNYIIPLVVVLSILISFFGFYSRFLILSKRFISDHTFVLFFMSLGMIIGNGTSAGLSELGIFFGFAIVLAYLADNYHLKFVGFIFVFCISSSLVIMLVDKKFDSPYAWWGVEEPSVRGPRYESVAPIARGLYLSKSTSTNFDEISTYFSQLDQNYSLFTFPNIPIFHLMSNTLPQSKVVVAWFDFLPDKEATIEAERILFDKPEIIIDLDLPESAWAAHERLFRNNKRLGQRSIKDAIDFMTIEKGLYNLELLHNMPNNCVLRIWKRID